MAWEDVPLQKIVIWASRFCHTPSISSGHPRRDLEGPGPYTVFAPTDDAFNVLPQKTRDALASDKALLKSVISYHVLPAKLASADVKNGNAKTVQGANVALSKAGTFVTVEDAVVTTPDVAATNGVVHIIDRVLMPPK